MDEPAETSIALERRASDVASGVQLVKEDFPAFTEEALEGHFAAFKHYDIEDKGFITPDNLMEIMKAMEVEVTMVQVKNMIEEVAILCEHPNDGVLSFRDYMKCMAYEAERDVHNASVEEEASVKVAHLREASTHQEDAAVPAAEAEEREEVVPELLQKASQEGCLDELDPAAKLELCQSFAELEMAKEEPEEPEPAPEPAPAAPEPEPAAAPAAAPAAEPAAAPAAEPAAAPAAAPAAEPAAAPAEEEEAPQQLMRGTSFKVFDNIAKKRINAFQNVVTTSVKDAGVDAPKMLAEESGKATENFKDKMARFKRIETAAPKKEGVKVTDEDIHKQTLKNKLAAFEEAGKKKDHVVAKKTWGKGGPGGQYTKKTVFVDGGDLTKPPPKKRIQDLL